MVETHLIAIVGTAVVTATISGLVTAAFVKGNQRRVLAASDDHERRKAERDDEDWRDRLEAGDYAYQREMEAIEESIEAGLDQFDAETREWTLANMHRFAAAHFQMIMAGRLSRAVIDVGRLTHPAKDRIYELSNALTALRVVPPSVERALEIITEPPPSTVLTHMEVLAANWFHVAVDLLDPDGADPSHLFALGTARATTTTDDEPTTTRSS